MKAVPFTHQKRSSRLGRACANTQHPEFLFLNNYLSMHIPKNILIIPGILFIKN